MRIKKYTGFYRYLLPYWRKVAVVLLLSIAASTLSLANPYLAKFIIDKAYGNKDLRLFILLMAIGGVIFILSAAFNSMSQYLNYYLRLRISFDLNRKIFKKLQGLSYGFFQGTSSSEHLYKINYDISQVAYFITEALLQVIILIVRALSIFVIVLRLNVEIALFTLILTPFLYPLPIYFTRKLRRALEAWVRESQSIFIQLGEILRHIQLIKAFGKTYSERKRYVAGLIKNIRLKLKSHGLELSSSFINSLVSRMAMGLVVLYGGYELIKGRLSLGSLSAIVIYLGQFLGLNNLSTNFLQRLSENSVSCDRLQEVFSLQPEFTDERDTKSINFDKGRIDFIDVSFSYGLNREVLSNLSFSIKGNSAVALVGCSGCGKTTIVSLMLKLHEPRNGKICIDGQGIKSINFGSFYRQIGVALQEPYLWNDSIENNIRYGREDASLREVVGAAEVVCMDSFIDSLPDKYGTVIGEGGCKVSEGQKQRIAIARAVIKKPKILILDEALSSVDAETEGKILTSIRSTLIDSTIIIISHRISTIKKLDLVYFLSAPNRIEINTHEALLEKNRQYQRYLADQLQDSSLTADSNSPGISSKR